jgi:CPA2 family monovalent cation:H+ antiporter-2
MTLDSPVVSLTILLVAALVGGMVAHRLKQPVILGYLLVGVAVGPYSLRLVTDLAITETAATIGVALLMLTLGMDVTFGQLRELGRVGIWGAIGQIFLTALLGVAAGVFIFHWPVTQAVVFGMIIYNGSTAVGLKLLMERGEMGSRHGRIMISSLILQDISVVVMLIAEQLMGAPVADMLIAVGLALGKAIVFLAVAIALGNWVLPWLLGRVGGVRARELFLLTVIVLCLGAALGTLIFGLSVVFGSFVIGLMLRRSRYATEALAEITPLRDIFAALFFVSLGMLLDPRFVLENWPLVLLVIGIILAIKFGVVYGLVRAFRYSNGVALLAGAGLIQVGEFGFILAQAGVAQGIVDANFYSLIVAAAIATMLFTPLSMSLAARVYPAVSSTPPAGGLPLLACKDINEPAADKRKIIVAGYGRVGKSIAAGLKDAGLPYTVIDIDPELVNDLKKCGCDCVYGDASNPHILDIANLCSARTLVVTYPDPLAVVTTIKNARRLSPELRIFARVQRPAEAEALRNLDVNELISPEYEAGMALLSRVLADYGWDHIKIEGTLDTLRRNPLHNQPIPDEEA